MAPTLAGDRRGIGTLGSLVVLLVVLALMFAVYYTFFIPPAPGSVVRARAGDLVTVDYIGYFDDTGLVFDTSNLTIARDNASWPKAVSFPGGPLTSWRPRWEAFRFTMGDGSVVRGFEEGVRSLAVGESRTAIIPPADGYGAPNPDLFVVKPILEEVPVRQVMNESTFVVMYQESPSSGKNVTDPFWGWPVLVSVADTVVTVTNSPTPGQIVRPHKAWDARVESVDDSANGGVGVIRVRHLLTDALEHRAGGKVAGQDFVLFEVDLDAGTYTLNFNREVVGRTLVFQMKVIAIFRL